MINFDEYFKYTIILFIIISIIIWIKKPKLIFNKNGKMRNYGIGPGKTVFYFPIVIIFLAITIYYIFLNLYLRKSYSI